jgi:hypothetical protein
MTGNVVVDTDESDESDESNEVVLTSAVLEMTIEVSLREDSMDRLEVNVKLAEVWMVDTSDMLERVSLELEITVPLVLDDDEEADDEEEKVRERDATDISDLILYK